MEYVNHKALVKGLRESLNLDSNWKIANVSFNSEAGSYTIHVEHKRGVKVACPETGECHSIYDHRRERTWRHTDINEYKCYVRCRIPRVKSSAGVKSIAVPWADPSNQYTNKFEIKVIDHLKDTCNQTKTAKSLRCGIHRVGTIVERSVERGLKRRRVVKVKHLSIDEKAIKRGHHYATILSDADTGCVLDLGLGRRYRDTRDLVERTIPEATRSEVATFTMDMWAPYIRVKEELLKEAKLIHDRFHLIKMLNAGVDKVRRREVKKYPELLRHSRFALLKNPINRTEKQNQVFQIIIEANIEVAKAWTLKEDFKSIFECKTIDIASDYFNLWLDRVLSSGIKEMETIAVRFKNHFEGVRNALYLEQSNSRAENLNGRIQKVKSIGRGYRKFVNFRAATLFFFGNLDLYPHISRLCLLWFKWFYVYGLISNMIFL